MKLLRLFAVMAMLLPISSAGAGGHVVIIDPGHGGSRPSGTAAARTLSSNNNATSPSGIKEKDIALELAREIVRQLEELRKENPGLNVRGVLTRDADVNPDFAQRAAVCASTKPLPRAIISIHFNASKGHDSLGTLAMIGHRDKNPNFDADKAFARRITDAASSVISGVVPGSKARAPITDSHLHGGLGSNFFHQLAQHPELARVPKCFLEVEFMDRRDVDDRLIKNRKTEFPRIARAIAAEIYRFCGE